MSSLALFDFDGTITNRDSLIEFILYARGPIRFCFGMLVLSPVLLFYKLRIVPGWRAKEILLNYFFGGMSLSEFQALCNVFSAHKVPKMLRPEAMEKMREH